MHPPPRRQSPATRRRRLPNDGSTSTRPGARPRLRTSSLGITRCTSPGTVRSAGCCRSMPTPARSGSTPGTARLWAQRRPRTSATAVFERGGGWPPATSFGRSVQPPTAWLWACKHICVIMQSMDEPTTQELLYERQARLCQVLADPKRLRLLDALRDREHSVGELADSVGVAYPNVFQHLNVMRDAGLVATRRE